jgi:hypothetical protein
LPKAISVTAGKPLTIGREPGEGVEVIGVPSISRSHVKIHHDSKGFILTPENQNEGKIKNVLEIESARAGNIAFAAETVIGNPLSEVDMKFEIPLRPGMTIQLHPQIPAYTVKTAIGGPTPQLELVMEGDNRGFDKASRIVMRGKDTNKSIGYVAGNDVVLCKGGISRLHANLAWDENLQSWSYGNIMGKTKPVVTIGNQFLRDIDHNLDQISCSPAQAKEQIQEIDGLISTWQRDRHLMDNVQKLELHTVVTPEWERSKGAYTEESQRGYQNWLHAYQLLYNEQMDNKEIEAIKTARQAMARMEEDRKTLREDVEPMRSPPIDSDGKNLKTLLKECKGDHCRDKYDKVLYHSRDEILRGLGQKQVEPLMEKPPQPSIIVSGFKGHHTVTKIEKDAKGYMVTTYNAGAGAKDCPDQSGNIMGMYQQHLKSGVDIEDFIRLLNERKVRSMVANGGYQVEAALENALGPVEKYRSESPQHKGNCTTRSTREMLKDMLAPERFVHLHRHVSNPEVCDPAEVLAALQMRRGALDKIQHVEKPADQVDWQESVISIRRAQGSQDIDLPWSQRSQASRLVGKPGVV